MTPIQVTCAIILHRDRILAVQRSELMSHPLKWEFPGGKIEANETEAACIVREIEEELGIIVEPTQRLTPVIHNYPNFTIELIPFVCRIISGSIELLEHKQYLWLSEAELYAVDWAEADCEILEKANYKLL